MSHRRPDWWRLKMFHASAIAEDPAWQAMLREIQEDIARQRAWCEARADQPLF